MLSTLTVLFLVNHFLEPSLGHFSSPVSPRIWNGFSTNSLRDFPYYAGVIEREKLRKRDLTVRCGGTIIHRKFVVTAASCIYYQWDYTVETPDGLVSIYDVIVATYRLNSTVLVDLDERSVHVHAVSEIMIHPDYVGEEDGQRHDIALLKLTSALTFSVAVLQPIDLPVNEVNELYTPEIKDIYYVSGYGVARPFGMQEKFLMTTPMKIKSETWCQTAFTMSFFGKEKRNVKLFDARYQICADGNTSHVCTGDMGGGLVGVPHRKQINFKDTPPKGGKLIGVLSWTPLFKGCGLALPAIYTRITKETVDWMTKYMNQPDMP